MPNAYSRAAKAHTHDNEGIRLQKLLAQAGFGSRRKCEEIITEGRVEIDGELVTELGTRVDPKHQEVRVDGSRVRFEQAEACAERHGGSEGTLHPERYRRRQV